MYISKADKHGGRGERGGGEPSTHYSCEMSMQHQVTNKYLSSDASLRPLKWPSEIGLKKSFVCS